ncbi:MAG: molybdopterin molybdotransferase MoeA [Romboutsia sp.]
MENIDLEIAIKVILDSVNEINDIEKIRIEDSRCRILGEDIYAPINQPPFDRSPLDGYALKSVNTIGSSRNTPVKLKVVDEVFAGGYSNRTLNDKEAIRIMTGAKIPKGADCIMRQEHTNYSMEDVEIYEELREYDNYCFEGEDIKIGEKLISKGEKLNYIHIGILASMGYETIKVKRQPKVAIVSTGDELTKLGTPLIEGKIYDSNRRMIEARLLDYGCHVINSDLAKDSEEEIANSIEKVIDSVDLVITTGGVSVGKKDLMHEVIKLLGGEKIFWRINIKPGTPVIYALYKDKPLLCLSGNPFAAIVTFELTAKELLYKFTGDKELKQIRKTAIMEDSFMKISIGRRIIRGIYKDNKIYLPKGGHSSGILGSMIGCNCLIDIKPGTEKLVRGDKVEIILLKE